RNAIWAYEDRSVVDRAGRGNQRGGHRHRLVAALAAGGAAVALLAAKRHHRLVQRPAHPRAAAVLPRRNERLRPGLGRGDQAQYRTLLRHALWRVPPGLLPFSLHGDE